MVHFYHCLDVTTLMPPSPLKELDFNKVYFKWPVFKVTTLNDVTTPTSMFVMLSHQCRNLKFKHQSEEASSSECKAATQEDHSSDIGAPKQPLESINKGVATTKLDK